MNSFVGLLTAAALASSAAASPASETTTRTFVLAGEILVYSQRVSGLPASTIVAPRGARMESELRLRVESSAAASPELTRSSRARWCTERIRSFCTPSMFNLTNAIQMIWVP